MRKKSSLRFKIFRKKKHLSVDERIVQVENSPYLWKFHDYYDGTVSTDEVPFMAIEDRPVNLKHGDFVFQKNLGRGQYTFMISTSSLSNYNNENPSNFRILQSGRKVLIHNENHDFLSEIIIIQDSRVNRVVSLTIKIPEADYDLIHEGDIQLLDGITTFIYETSGGSKTFNIGTDSILRIT